MLWLDHSQVYNRIYMTCPQSVIQILEPNFHMVESLAATYALIWTRYSVCLVHAINWRITSVSYRVRTLPSGTEHLRSAKIAFPSFMHLMPVAELSLGAWVDIAGWYFKRPVTHVTMVI
jgi:hypothetical protein